MSPADTRPAARVARGAIAGMVAGAVASFAMDRFQAVVAPLLPSDDAAAPSEPATERAADALAAQITGRAVPAADKPSAGQAVHYAFGIALGVGYGIAAEFRPVVTAGRGAGFAIATATLFDEALVPAAGLGAAPWRSAFATHLYSYASHLVFGGVSEIVRRQVAGTLIDQTGATA